MISAFLLRLQYLRFLYLVLPFAYSFTSFSICFKSKFLIFGSTTSSTNGLPSPNINTSISSLPAPWNLQERPLLYFNTISDNISSTDSGYNFPV